MLILGGSIPTSITFLFVDQISPIFFVQRGRDRGRSSLFPIFDILIHAGDIRGQSPKLSEIALFIRPPGTVVPGGLMFYCWCLLIYLFFNSPRDLRAPSADRRETLPRDRPLVQFYNPGPKILGALPPKKVGGQKHAKFRSISDHSKVRLLRSMSFRYLISHANIHAAAFLST